MRNFLQTLADRRVRVLLAVAVAFFLFDPPAAEAYIGPGAGFAFVSSFFVIIATFFLAFLKLITTPFRVTVRWLKMRKALAKSRVKRVVIVGLDGQDPKLTDGVEAPDYVRNYKRK